MPSSTPIWLRIVLALVAAVGMASAVAAFGLGSMMFLAMMADAGMKNPELAEKAMLGYLLGLALAGSCGLTLGLAILLTRHRKKLLVATLVQVLVSVLLAATAVAVYFKAVAG